MIQEKMKDVQLNNHLIICGWDEKVVAILQFILEKERKCGKKRATLILTDKNNTIPWKRIQGDDVYRAVGDLTEEEILATANLDKAYNVILLADEKEHELADAKSILIVLAMKSFSRESHICVEAIHPDNIASLKLARANHIISIPNIREKLIAQAAITHYVSHIYRELFDVRQEQNIFSLPVSEEFLGKRFRDVARKLYERGMILIAIWDHDSEKVQINPPGDRTFGSEDNIIVIARQSDFDFTQACGWV